MLIAIEGFSDQLNNIIERTMRQILIEREPRKNVYTRADLKPTAVAKSVAALMKRTDTLNVTDTTFQYLRLAEHAEMRYRSLKPLLEKGHNVILSNYLRPWYADDRRLNLKHSLSMALFRPRLTIYPFDCFCSTETTDISLLTEMFACDKQGMFSIDAVSVGRNTILRSIEGSTKLRDNLYSALFQALARPAISLPAGSADNNNWDLVS